MTHSVRIKNIDTNNQNAAIGVLIAQNNRFHKKLKIAKMSWFKNAIEVNKTFSFFIIETTSFNNANVFIKQSIIKDYEVKICIVFYKSIQLNQCFKCHEYEHFAKNCKITTKCGKCARRHETNECKKSSLSCAVCKTPGHEAGFKKCKIKREHMNRLNIVKAAQPVFYAEGTQSTQISNSFPSIRSRKRDRTAFLGPASSIAATGRNNSVETLNSGLTFEWQKAFTDKVSEPSAKKNYIQLKINHKQSLMDDDENLGRTNNGKFCNTTSKIKKTQRGRFNGGTMM